MHTLIIARARAGEKIHYILSFTVNEERNEKEREQRRKLRLVISSYREIQSINHTVVNKSKNYNGLL